MSDHTATRARPLSPHLTIYRFTPTIAMSIVHRITGIALYFGTLLVAWWLVAAATSPQWFATANWVLGSWIGTVVLIGFTWAMWHHALGGIRHFVWDLGHGTEKATSRAMSIASLVGSIVLTVLTWAAYLFVA